MKNKIIIVILISIGLISVYSKCNKNREDCHRIIYINNKSNNAIYYDFEIYYPDTSIDDYNFVIEGDLYKVNSQSTKGDYSRSCYEDKFQYTNKLMYFIFDANTIETTQWDTVRANYLILKRYDLSLQDLQNSNWTITYP